MMVDIPEVGPSTPVLPTKPARRGNSRIKQPPPAKRKQPDKSSSDKPNPPTHIDEYV